MASLLDLKAVVGAHPKTPARPRRSLRAAKKLDPKKRSDVRLPVDELMMCQPKLTTYITALMTIEPVLACEEMRGFLTDAGAAGRDGPPDEDEAKPGGILIQDRQLRLIIERFGKGKNADEDSIEQALTEGMAVGRQKIGPSQSHPVSVAVEEAGQMLVWCFTTLPSRSQPAKDVAFSVSFNGHVVKPYERLSKVSVRGEGLNSSRLSPNSFSLPPPVPVLMVKVQDQLIKGSWNCPTPGTAVLTFHNDYRQGNPSFPFSRLRHTSAHHRPAPAPSLMHPTYAAGRLIVFHAHRISISRAHAASFGPSTSHTKWLLSNRSSTRKF